MKKLLLPLALSASLFTGVAMAGSTSADFTVSADVNQECLVDNLNLDAGTVGVFRPTTSINVQGALTMNCTGEVAYSIAINDTNQQWYKDGVLSSNKPTVVFYQDSARTQRWANGSTTTVSGTSTNGLNTFQVYGAIQNNTSKIMEPGVWTNSSVQVVTTY